VVGTHWDPKQYLKFCDHRLRPAIELLDRIPIESPKVIFDLGCGPGNVTRIIADRWKSAKVYGLDSSRDMLQKARLEPAEIQWVEADIENWIPHEAPELIYSNATLHWVRDHHELFPRLAGFVKAGGCLAVQMPLSWNAASLRLMRETLADGGQGGSPLGTKKLRQTVARKWVEETEVYYDLLAGRVESLDIWETEYLQILEGDDPALEWVRGTALRPVLDGLADDEREIFLNKYRQRLRKAYPVKPDGRTIYPFRRLFIVALV
jgi:trans-aconitate 2-methyltransferase